MKQMITIFLIALATLSTASPIRNRRQLPCSHPLRISRPHLFTHCDCTYTAWSEWEIVAGSTITVATSVCASGEAYNEQRRKTALGDNCNDQTETRSVCVPDDSDRLILALNLGGAEQDYSSVQHLVPQRPDPAPRPRTSNNNNNGGYIIQTHSFIIRPRPIINSPQHCPRNGRNPQVCDHLTGKRSADMHTEEKLPQDHKLAVPQDKVDSKSSYDENAVMQFSWEEHSHRFRRQVHQCGSDDVQHVLFVLDSSGSIGQKDYNRMKTAVANLTTLFCKKVKFALVTFSSDIHLDFCFNCFQNTFSGRVEASDAIKAASYLDQWTRTGDTVRCICDEILRPTCGITSSPDCLDVVLITDGHSNHGRKVCDEIRCLHGRLGVNTYSIGIGNGVDRDELDCIADGSDRLSAFQFDDFDNFETAIRKVGDRLANVISTSPLSCAALSGNIDPNNGIPFK